MSPYEIMENFVDLIEKERIRQNLKQKDLYTAAGISSSAYSMFLKNKNTSFLNVIKLMFVLNLNDKIDSLLEIKKYVSIDEIRAEQKDNVKKRIRKN